MVQYLVDFDNEFHYRGFCIYIGIPHKRIECMNPISGAHWTEHEQTKGKSKWFISGPTASSQDTFKNYESAREFVDFLIKFGEKYYNWTDADRTGHQIKKRKYFEK